MRWHLLAFAATYGNQSVFELLGRDPATEPLSPIELGLLVGSVEALKVAEFTPKESGDYVAPPSPPDAGGEE